jgi:ribonuclease HIII
VLSPEEQAFVAQARAGQVPSPGTIRLAGSKPKVKTADIATASKVARDAGEALSIDDVDFLAKKYGIKLPEGAAISGLRKDVAGDLLLDRKLRHNTLYDMGKTAREGQEP